MKVFFDEQGEWERQHVRNLSEKTKSRYAQVEQEISNKHKVINLSFCTKWLEMCFQRIAICNCFFNDQNIAKYTKLYDEGFEKLQNDLNLIKLVNNSKLMMAHQKSQGMNNKRLFKLKHTMENVIDLDSDKNQNGSYEGQYDIKYQTYQSKFDPIVERNIDSQILFKQSLSKVDIAVPNNPNEEYQGSRTGSTAKSSKTQLRPK